MAAKLELISLLALKFDFPNSLEMEPQQSVLFPQLKVVARRLSVPIYRPIAQG